MDWNGLKLCALSDLRGDKTIGFLDSATYTTPSSRAKIKAKLGNCIEDFLNLSTEEEYHEKHKEYCEWFTGNIKTVERKKMGRIIISTTSTIEDIDELQYNELQKMMRSDDIEKLFAGEIFPVQYGDIKWRGF